jgi:short-subunit dehydrogenase
MIFFQAVIEKMDRMTNKAIEKKSNIIITGASTGIGQALALLLAKKYSANLVLNARGIDELNETVKKAQILGSNAISVVGDIASSDIQDKLVEICLEKYGKPDILINNAGLAKSGPMMEITFDDWQKVFAVNFFAALRLIYKIAPYMIEKKQGKIVNVSSLAGKIAFPGSVCYSASKFALTGLSSGIAAEFSQYGVQVVTVSPGWVRTNFFVKNASSEDPTQIAQGTNLKAWLMRNILSISSETAALQILKTMESGKSKDIVLTMPAIILERLVGICPDLTFALSRKIPANRRKNGL